jgi:hypothetical protein
MDIGTLTGVVAIEDQLTGKLRTLSSTVWKFVDNYGGAMATAAFSTAALTTAVLGTAVSIVKLGEKGSEILGVEDAFNRLAISVGSTGEALSKALSSGVRNTVDSMDLMKGTTRLLSSGLKVTADDLNLMAKVAREVGKATGEDAASGLNVLSSAMLTGNARSLKRYGIQIDLVKAEKEFRQSLGGTTAALSAAGKLEVNRIAVLAGMRAKLDALGESELSFKERVQQVGVALGNWVDDLAKAVAASPNVLRAFDSIAEAVKRAFGTSSQTMLDVVVKWINRFADAVSYWGPVIIRVVASIRDRIIFIWEAVVKAWNLVPDWFKNIAKEAALAGGALYLTNKLLGQMAGGSDALSLAASWSTITSGINDFTRAAITLVPRAVVQIKSLTDAMKILYLLGSFAGGGVMGGIGGVLTGIGAGMAAMAGSAGGITVLVTGFAAALWQVFKAVDALSENWKRGGGTLWGFLTLKEDDTFARRWLSLAGGINETAKAVERLHKGQMKARDVLPVISPGYVSGGAAAAKARDEATNAAAGYGPQKGLFEDTTAEKVKALTKSWSEAAMSSNVFRIAFGSLTEEQRKNHDIQQMLLPEIQKLSDAHQRLTPTMIDVANSAMDTRLAYIEKDKAFLESIELTETQVSEMKKLGMSELDIATQLGVTTTALQLRIAAMGELQTRQEALAAFENALVTQQAADNTRREAIALAANKAIGASYEELNDLINQQTMTSTEYQIQKIKEQEAASIAAFSATGASAQAIKEFTDVAIALSNRRVGVLKIDNDALNSHSKKTLQEVADKARATYEAMAANPEQYSKATRRHFKQIAEDAQHAADGTKSVWDQAYGAMGDVADILDNIPGKFAEIGAMAARAGQAIMSNLAEGDWIGALVAGVTAGIGIIKKLFGGLTDYQKRVREEAKQLAETNDLRRAFIDAAGGLTTLNQRALDAGTTLERVLNARTPEAYKKAIDELNASFEFQDNAMRTLDETVQKYGLTLSEMGPQYRQGKLNDSFRELYQDQEVLKAGGVDFDLILRKQADSFKTLIQAALETGSTIPETMRESIMRMNELGLFTDEAGKALFDLTKLNFAETLDAKFETLIDSIGRLVDAITRGLGGALRSIPHPEAPWADWDEVPDIERRDNRGRPEIVEPSYYAGGGTVVAFRPRGTDTVPAMLTPGERVIPRGEGGGKVVVELNSRWLAETVVPEIPGAVKRMGIR